MKMSGTRTKGQYIKWNKKIVMLLAVMLLAATGCSKKESEAVTTEPTPVITQIPAEEEVIEPEGESPSEVDQEAENEESDGQELVSDSVDDQQEDTNNQEDANDQTEVTVTPEASPEEDFSEEDPVETIAPEGEVLTKEQAVAAVARFSKETLGLANELGQYTIIVDEWTTMVKGKECYCLNVYDYVNDRQQLVKMFYVTMDGKEVFIHDDELGEFTRIAE